MSVHIELIDFTPATQNETLNRLLMEKFSQQRKMFIKWIRRRDEFLSQSFGNSDQGFAECFIPIEFTNERLCMIKQLSSSTTSAWFAIPKCLIETIDPLSIDPNMFDDDEFMFNSISMNGNFLALASPRIRENYFYCKTALDNNLTHYDCVLNKDALKLFQRSRLEFQHFNGKNEEECVEIVQHAICEGMEINFSWLPDSVLCSKKCAKLLVSKFDCLQFFTNDIKDDIEIVTISCLKTKSICFASERIKSSKEIVMKLLDQISPNPDGCNILRYCSTELRDDIEVVTKAVKSCTLQISYASKRLQSDTELMFQVLELAKEEYKYGSWSEFVFYNSLACRNSIAIHNKNLLLKSLESSCIMYEYAPIELRNDNQVIEMATRHYNKFCIEHIPNNHPIRKDHAFITSMIQQNGTSIRYFDISVRSNPDYCMAAIKQNGQALRHVHNPTMEMRIEAVKQNGYCERNSNFENTYQEMYNIRMEHEYGSLYLPSHLVASKEKTLQCLSVSKQSKFQSYDFGNDWYSTFDYEHLDAND